MANWETYKEDYLLFVEAGFIAVNQADEDATLKLFRAADLLNPDNTLAKVGYGYLHLHKLELKQAVQRFEEVLAQEPTNEMAKAFLGVCTSLIPNQTKKGEDILHESLKSKDPMIKKLADTAIDFVERFVKTKKPGPATRAK
jgi:hypothetical protein